MKKVLVCLMVTLLVAFSLTAFSDYANQSGASIRFTAEVGEGYTVALSNSSFNIAYGTTTSTDVTVSLASCKLADGKKVIVSGSPNLPLESSSSSTPLYMMVNMGGVPFSSVDLATEGAQATLQFVIQENAWKNAKPGSYSGTYSLTFSVAQ